MRTHCDHNLIRWTGNHPWLSKSQSVELSALSIVRVTHRIRVKLFPVRRLLLENSLSILRRNSPNLRFARTRISLSVRALSSPMHRQAAERIHVKGWNVLGRNVRGVRYAVFTLPNSAVWGTFAKSSSIDTVNEQSSFSFFFFLSKIRLSDVEFADARRESHLFVLM